jgi:hypothetical protein
MYAAGVYRPIASAIDSNNAIHHIEYRDAAGALSRRLVGQGGENWVDAGAAGITGDRPYSGAAVADQSNGDAAMGADGVTGTNGLYYATAAAGVTWTLWAGTAGKRYVGIDYDPVNGYWIGLDASAGTIDTIAIIGAALTNRFTNATLANQYSCIQHSKHAAATLYPDDPGNLVALAVGAGGGGWYRATDAASATWSTLAPAPWTPLPADRGCLKYSYVGSRWGILTNNGPGSASKLTFAYSDDNGDNWVEVVDAFDLGGRTHGNWVTGTDDAVLLTDGWGHWFAAFNTQVTSEHLEFWGSDDNGETWFRIFMPMDTSTVAGTQYKHVGWYGDGAFWVAHLGNTGAVTYSEICASHRVGE